MDTVYCSLLATLYLVGRITGWIMYIVARWAVGQDGIAQHYQLPNSKSYSKAVIKFNGPKFSGRQVRANSVDADQSDQGLHCLLFSQNFVLQACTSFSWPHCQGNSEYCSHSGKTV